MPSPSVAYKQSTQDLSLHWWPPQYSLCACIHLPSLPLLDGLSYESFVLVPQGIMSIKVTGACCPWFVDGEQRHRLMA